jgi:hypothetical protein
MRVLQQELQSKIAENVQLHNQIVELTQQHGALLGEQLADVERLKQQLTTAENERDSIRKELKAGNFYRFRSRNSLLIWPFYYIAQGEAIAAAAAANTELDEARAQLAAAEARCDAALESQNSIVEQAASVAQSSKSGVASSVAAPSSSSIALDLLATPLPTTVLNNNNNDDDDNDDNNNKNLLARDLLLSRNAATVPHRRVALYRTALSTIQRTLHSDSNAAADTNTANNTNATTTNNSNNNSNLLACEAAQLDAMEAALDARNRARDAGLELITHNSAAVAGARRSLASLRALCSAATTLLLLSPSTSSSSASSLTTTPSNTTTSATPATTTTTTATTTSSISSEIAALLDAATVWARDARAASTAEAQAALTGSLIVCCPRLSVAFINIYV